MTRRPNEAAFTIVELLIAAAITVLIVVLLGSMFGALSSTAARANERVDAFRDARAALQMIQRDLSGLVKTNRDANDNPITKPAAYLTLQDIYSDPVTGNQQVYALVSLKNSGLGDVCSVGYYCRWDDQGGNNYSLRRFFRDSTATLTNLSKSVTYAPITDLYIPDAAGTKSNAMQDSLLASNVWDLRITAYDAAANVIAYPYVCDAAAKPSNPLPAALEISFKAMSANAARTVVASGVGADVWMNEGDARYKRLIAPHVYEFRSRIYLH